ncbi:MULTISPECIES: hypothetical protein [Nostocales]|uniref:Uncharacterized protein n=2 Tax=Tolypothrix TaxID=111782 RepID=A0A8S9TB10_9CYAN|nr:hypothetical protein [Tolypothrix bouteillei]KAF3888619.1 hypothetical protein DA73_0400026420 [Tolypothrix bouteillei VB521301]
MLAQSEAIASTWHKALLPSSFILYTSYFLPRFLVNEKFQAQFVRVYWKKMKVGS